jgi:diguanylate cyclase (GGDEF)-like protein/PAS domain S-box-containing protein
MIIAMSARYNQVPCLAILSRLPNRALALLVLPLPAQAASFAAPTSVLGTLLVLSVALAAFFCRYRKRRSEQSLRQSELMLDAARQELLNCRDQARELAEQAERARQASRLEHERLTQALCSSEQRLRLHLDCTSELVFALDLDGCLRQLSRSWGEALGVDVDSLLGQHHAWLVHPDDLPACQRRVERALMSRSPQHDIRYRIRHAGGEWRWHSARIVPLRNADGQITGLLGLARVIGEGARHGPQALRQSHFDPLTGLPGRSLCLDRLQQMLGQAERHAKRTALLLIRLEGFRALNERHGHGWGDLVLLESCARITASIRSSDTVGRQRGANFIVLLPELACEREAVEVARKLQRVLQEPLQLRGSTLELKASIGLAVYPRHGLDQDELVTQAEQSLARAREDREGRIAWPLLGPVSAAPLAAQAA